MKAESSSLVEYEKYCKNPSCRKAFKSNARNSRYCCDKCREAGRKQAGRRAKNRREYKKDASNRRAQSMSRKQAREFAISEIVSFPCHRCGTVLQLKDLETHHRDGNPFNNDKDNLAILCLSCHSKSDNEWREARKNGTENPDCRLYGASIRPVKVLGDSDGQSPSR